MLTTTTARGLHEFLVQQVLPRFFRPGTRAVDLGAGSGALAVELCTLGFTVLAVDRNRAGYGADLPFLEMNLDQPDFAAACGAGAFSLVTAVEVIEHMESPIGFLRNVGRLLAPDGAAVITTPNVDNLPARLKFLTAGRIRTMDRNGEPTHISPIFLDLLERQYLPRASLRIAEHMLHPRGDYLFTRSSYARILRLAARLFPGRALTGDNHIFVLRRSA